MDRNFCIDRVSDHLGSFLSLLREAGQRVLSVYKEDFAVVFKSDDSPLTLADSESHDLLLGNLPSILPVPVLSEEGQLIPLSDRASWQAFWSIDPLDGTREFVRRSGEFCISVGLVLDGHPIFGGIDIPVEDRIYFGGEGFGSYRIEGARVDSLAEADLAKILQSSVKLGPDGHGDEENKRPWVILGSVSHKMALPSRLMESLSKKEHFLSRSVGSAIKFCRIAEGSADFYPRFGRTMEWDTAAGQSIVSGVGGDVVEIPTKKSLHYNKPVLENPEFYCFGPRFRKRYPELLHLPGRAH